MDIYNTLRSISAPVSLVGSTTLLFTLIFSTTFDHPLLPYFRLLLSLPASILCIAFAFFEPVPWGDSLRGLKVQVSTIGLYGLMRVLDVAVVGFNEKTNERPRWVLNKKNDVGKGKARSRGNGRPGGEDGRKATILPMPITLRDRLIYSFDLILSVRGSSFIKGRVFDFAPHTITTFDPPQSRIEFLKACFPTFALCYLRLDLLETVSKSRKWDTTREHPLTSLPMHLQLFYTASAGLTIMHSLPNVNDMVNFTCIILFQAPTKAFPPLFASPLRATSLADWWANRWNPSFKQMFVRLSLPFLRFIPKHHTRTLKFGQAVMAFLFSTVLHIGMFLVYKVDQQHPHIAWHCPGMIKFFMLQPIGLLIESRVVKPSTQSLPPLQQLWLRRLYMYAWLLWTGRDFADSWIGMGLLDDNAIFVLFSPIRGLWKGRWISI